MTFGRDAGSLLARILDGPIRAVPYQQFGSGRVVLRAEFKLRLAKMLPDDLYQRLGGSSEQLPVELLEPVTLRVDLFKTSGVVRYAIQAAEIADTGLIPRDIAKKLGCTVRTARCDALRSGDAPGRCQRPFHTANPEPGNAVAGVSAGEMAAANKAKTLLSSIGRAA